MTVFFVYIVKEKNSTFRERNLTPQHVQTLYGFPPLSLEVECKSSRLAENRNKMINHSPLDRNFNRTLGSTSRERERKKIHASVNCWRSGDLEERIFFHEWITCTSLGRIIKPGERGYWKDVGWIDGDAPIRYFFSFFFFFFSFFLWQNKGTTTEVIAKEIILKGDKEMGGNEGREISEKRSEKRCQK